MCRESLDEGKSVVIDNTNTTKDARRHYVKIADEVGVPIRCFFLTSDKLTCLHNNFMRKVNVSRTHMGKAVPPVVINSYFKNHTEP